MRDKKNLDRAYNFFYKQILNHNNSEPFVVKGVGNYAKKNMYDMLSRAEQEIDVYFKKIDSSESILNARGQPRVVYTFLLKGRLRFTMKNCLKDLCSKGFVIGE